MLTTSSSPSASNVAGSGIGPSITHRLDSYFVLMKFSIFLKPYQQGVRFMMIVDLPIRGHMSGRQFCLPVSVLSESKTNLFLAIYDSLVRPRISPT